MTYHKITPYLPHFLAQLEAIDEAFKLGFNPNQRTQILTYLDGLLVWNKTYNLTAITDPKEAFIKHMMDCLAIVPSFDTLIAHANLDKVSVLDIGTGAGLPASLLAIARPDWQISALDSNSKKIRFIRQMKGELALTNLTPIHARIEAHSLRYNIVTSRAFASLADFVAVGQCCLTENGRLCAMKGKAPTPTELPKDWHATVIPLTIPELDSERCLVALSRLQDNNA